jgi:hypothetical protein
MRQRIWADNVSIAIQGGDKNIKRLIELSTSLQLPLYLVVLRGKIAMPLYYIIVVGEAKCIAQKAYSDNGCYLAVY